MSYGHAEGVLAVLEKHRERDARILDFVEWVAGLEVESDQGVLALIVARAREAVAR